MKKMILILMLAIGCGGDPPPSCVQALTHFYAAGCRYFDQRANPPAPISQGDMITFCQTAATQIPAACHDELDGWLVCNNRVPDHAISNADCDCSSSYMLLLECR